MSDVDHTPCLDPTCGCCESWRGLVETTERKLDRLRGALVAAGVSNRLVNAIEDPDADPGPEPLTGVIRPPAEPVPQPGIRTLPLLESDDPEDPQWTENRPDLQHITADGETTLCGVDMADWTGPALFSADWCEECQTLDAEP